MLKRIAFCLISLSLLVLSSVFAEEVSEVQRLKDERIMQTVMRLPDFDLNSKPEAKAAIIRHLKTREGDEKFADIVEKLKLVEEFAPSILKIALANPESNQGVSCTRVLIRSDKLDGFKEAVNNKNDKNALQALRVLELAAFPKTVPIIEPIVTDMERSVAVRTAAVSALGKTVKGEKSLLAIVVDGKLPADLKFVAATSLLDSTDEQVKTEAAKHVSLPATADSKPLPPIAQLVKMTGDATNGKALFENKGTCIKCHIVNGEGKEVGPNLSEIGSKLSRDAFYLSILDPSAGISFNYETSQIVTTAGQVLSGIITSDTAESVTFKTPEAIVRTVPRDEIEEIVKLKISLMPADLQKQLTAQDLVDIVEFLSTLKKKG